MLRRLSSGVSLKAWRKGLLEDKALHSVEVQSLKQMRLTEFAGALDAHHEDIAGALAYVCNAETLSIEEINVEEWQRCAKLVRSKHLDNHSDPGHTGGAPRGIQVEPRSKIQAQ